MAERDEEMIRGTVQSLRLIIFAQLSANEIFKHQIAYPRVGLHPDAL